jgi:hypothetical protein
MFYGAPTTKVASMDQDVTLRQRKGLGVSVGNTHKSRPALTRMWRDIISVIVVHDDGGVGIVSVSWIRGLESVFTGSKRGHGGLAEKKAGQWVFKEQTAGMHVHCALHGGTCIRDSKRRLAPVRSANRL